MRRRLPQMTAHLTEDARTTWKLWARSRDVTVSALLEALSEELAGLDGPDGGLPPVLRRAVVRGREIEAERRERQRD